MSARFTGPTGEGQCHQTDTGLCSTVVPADRPAPDNHTVQPVRCYRCGHQYAAVPDRLDTACPECGSNSYVRVIAPGSTKDDQ